MKALLLTKKQANYLRRLASEGMFEREIYYNGYVVVDNVIDGREAHGDSYEYDKYMMDFATKLSDFISQEEEGVD